MKPQMNVFERGQGMNSVRRVFKGLCFLGFVWVILAAWSATCMADVVTANLTIDPTPCKRGDVLRFGASVFNNPIVGTAPGTAYYGAVILDNTNHPELNPWSSELQVFKYPAPGNKTPINFTGTYTVPQNLKGTTICFYLTEGQAKTNRISYKTCIMVQQALLIRKPFMRDLKTVPPK
jgi:hypothetical protein